MSSVNFEVEKLLESIGYKYTKKEQFGFILPFSGKNGQIDINIFTGPSDFDSDGGGICSISARLSFYTPSDKMAEVLLFLNEKSSVSPVGAYEIQTHNRIVAFKIGFLTYPGLTKSIFERYLMTALVAVQAVEERVWEICAVKVQ